MPETVSIQDLTPEQLSQLKSQMENDIQGLEQAFLALKQASAKFANSRSALDSLLKKHQGVTQGEMFIPVTSSLYVPGRISDPSQVTIDLGTGYYARMATSEAVAYYERKCAMLDQEMQKVSESANMKVQQKDQVTEALQRKWALAAA